MFEALEMQKCSKLHIVSGIFGDSIGLNHNYQVLMQAILIYQLSIILGILSWVAISGLLHELYNISLRLVLV